MNDIQQRIVELQAKGWTIAAIADELDVHHSTVRRWESGDRFPENAKPVLMAFDALLQRKRIPKQRRYVPGSRKRKPENQDSGLAMHELREQLKRQLEHME